MSKLFLTIEDQITELERIFLAAKDQWSIDKHPSFLRIQMDALRTIRSLRYNLDSVNNFSHVDP
jgi:hypothetical protein